MHFWGFGVPGLCSRSGRLQSYFPKDFWGCLLCKDGQSFGQKTREGCGCFRGLFGGSRGIFRESPRKIAGKYFPPNHEMLPVLGFRAPGKANLPGTFGPHCRDLVPSDSPPSVQGIFEIDSSSLLEFV